MFGLWHIFEALLATSAGYLICSYGRRCSEHDKATDEMCFSLRSVLRLRSSVMWCRLIWCICAKDLYDPALFSITNVCSMCCATAWCRWTHLNRERFTGLLQVSQSFVRHFTLLYYPWIRLSSQYSRTAVSCGVRLEEKGDDASGSTRVASPHACTLTCLSKGWRAG